MRRFMLFLAITIVPLAAVGVLALGDRWPDWRGGRDYVVTVDLPAPGARAALPRIDGPMDASRPLVVIDPGHGGKDPGAGNGTVREKTLTLALATALRDELLRHGGIRVAMTRTDDRYLFLGERGQIARKLGADLFISIHADSTEISSGATGATVYTLSARGSSEVAERMAARENAADMIGGVRIAEQAASVGAILVDLSQRETQARSEAFARLILREGQGRIPFKEDAPQSAAFAVLKSPEMPSVLFESGYINNPADVARLTSPNGQADFAQVVASAIRALLARTGAANGAG